MIFRPPVALGVAALLWLGAGCGDDNDRGTAPPPTGLTVANLNFVHGFSGDCPNREFCRLADRVELLFQWIVAAGCPDVVTLQEIWRESAPLIEARIADACPFPYQAVLGTDTLGPDEEMVLTRYPVLQVERRFLFLNFRRALFVRIAHPLGPLDVFSTHLAATVDLGRRPCGTANEACPEECVAAGALTNRDCQAVQVAAFVESRHDVETPAVVTGDFNDPPGSFVYRQFTERGWTDTYLAAGNPECDPETGIGCTSGRVDDDLSDLESASSINDERIDYIFLVPPGPTSSCRASIDGPDDRDRDGTATKIFADDPNPFAPSCGPAPLPICWPSDHEGVQLDLNCG